MMSNQECPNCGTPLAAGSKHATCPKCLLGLALNGNAGQRQVNVATSAYHGEANHGWTFADLEARFPQLEILGLIGQGGMGAVYRVRQKALDRVVALKVLPSRSSGDPSFEERFVREARTLAKLSHPNIVTVFEFGEQDGLYFFLMEFVDGVNLRSLMNDGSLTSGEALSIVGQVCDALQYAHEMAIVHRDIKPENVLIDQRGQVKIADFGLAKILAKPAHELTLTGAHQVVGTPHYMAPEQMERPAEVDHRADIYSLGVVFYELLTGELPLGRFAPPSKRANVEGALDDVVMRTLEKEPAERYQQVNELKTDCSRIGSLPHAEQSRKDDRRASHSQSSAPIMTTPCSLPSRLEGIYDYVGILRLNGDRLELQYRGQEGFTGSSPLGTKEAVFPLNQIDTIEFSRGLSKHTVYITPLDLNVVDGLPGFENGRAVIYVAKKDRQVVEEMVAECGRRSRVRIIIPPPPSPAQALRTVRMPALGMGASALISILVLLGLNGAAVFSDATRGLGTVEFGIIGGAVSVFLAFQVFILIGAIQMYFVRNRGLATAAAIGCCIPMSPWSLLGIGMGVWALIVLRRDEVSELFESEGGAPVAALQSSIHAGKPMADEHLRRDAAKRLSLPTAGMRLTGCLSLFILFSAAAWAFQGAELASQLGPAAMAWRETIAYAALIAALPSCFLILAKTSSSRSQLIGLSILGVLPVTLLWPITVWFSAWTLLVLLDPDVKQVQQRAPLPRICAPKGLVVAVSTAFALVFLLTAAILHDQRDIIAPGSPVFWFRAESTKDGGVLGEENLVAARNALESRLKLGGIRVSVQSDEEHGHRIVSLRNLSSSDVNRFMRLSECVGEIELALLRDNDANAHTVAIASDAAVDLPYAVVNESAGGGVRIAVLNDTRFRLRSEAVDDIDVSNRRVSQGYRLEIELSNKGLELLQAKWQSKLDRLESPSAKPLHFAMIFDGRVCGVGFISLRKKGKLDDDIDVKGALPLPTTLEWKAVIRSGPLPARFWIRSSPDESPPDGPTL